MIVCFSFYNVTEYSTNLILLLIGYYSLPLSPSLSLSFHFLSEWDVDEAGMVSFEEFEAAVAHCISMSGAAASSSSLESIGELRKSREQIRRLFIAMQHHDDEVLEIDGLAHRIDAVEIEIAGVHWPRRGLVAVLNDFDEDADGMLSYHEFEAAASYFYCYPGDDEAEVANRPLAANSSAKRLPPTKDAAPLAGSEARRIRSATTVMGQEAKRAVVVVPVKANSPRMKSSGRMSGSRRSVSSATASASSTEADVALLNVDSDTSFDAAVNEADELELYLDMEPGSDDDDLGLEFEAEAEAVEEEDVDLSNFSDLDDDDDDDGDGDDDDELEEENAGSVDHDGGGATTTLPGEEDDDDLDLSLDEDEDEDANGASGNDADGYLDLDLEEDLEEDDDALEKEDEDEEQSLELDDAGDSDGDYLDDDDDDADEDEVNTKQYFHAIV